MSKVHSNGLFITLEGGEGSGKTTLMQKLADYFVSYGYEVLMTREPGGTLLGETIRNWLLEQNSSFKMSDQAELFLFLAARSQHLYEKIQPALAKGQVVLCDRFNESTIAYQGGARGLGIEYVQHLCQMACGETKPNLTLYLDVKPEVGLNRAKSTQKENAASGELDRIESEHLSFHQTIKSIFDDLAKADPERIVKIDANQSKNVVLQEATSIIEKHFSISPMKNPV
ncbi:MAG: dTMP kinase [Parachlamydiaceae bacterium]|nr:dTMP kinase [Parachlamydiaceae bacterium]